MYVYIYICVNIYIHRFICTSRKANMCVYIMYGQACGVSSLPPNGMVFPSRPQQTPHHRGGKEGGGFLRSSQSTTVDSYRSQHPCQARMFRLNFIAAPDVLLCYNPQG